MQKIIAALSLTFALLTSYQIQGQITVSNAEKFAIGMNISYVYCDNLNIDTGVAGPNISWDYSNLIPIDTSEMRIISPDSTSYDAFKDADFVEFTDDSTYVFVKQSDTISHLIGFASVAQDIVIDYTKSQSFMKRPMTFLDKYSETFSVKYKANSYDFTGTGSSTIEADGYGDLILPDGPHQNVLRIVIRQNQIDTLIQFNSTFESQNITYLWFDGLHPEPLLRITKYSSSQGTTTRVGYREQSNTLSSSTRGLQLKGTNAFPNPFSDKLQLQINPDLINQEFTIVNELGSVIKSGKLTQENMTIEFDEVAKGTYCLFINSTFLQKIIKN